MNEAISKIIPILSFLFLGYVFREKQIIKEENIVEIKKFTTDFALSSVILITFSKMELNKEYYIFSFLIFFFLCLMLILTLLLNKIKYIYHPLLPFMTSGCALYLLGIPLFSSIYGIENVKTLSMFGVGHEVFIWIVLYPLLIFKFNSIDHSVNIFSKLLKTPTIISIFIGLTLNVIGFSENNSPILKGLYSTVETLAGISTPLLLIIIGYGLRLNKNHMSTSLKLLIIRILLILTVGYLYKIFIVEYFITTDKIFNYAYFTFLILPLPVPIIASINSSKEIEELANNTLVLNTIISIVMFIILAVI